MNTLFKRFNMEHPTFESLNSPWPKGEPNTGYAQYFIGNSYLATGDDSRYRHRYPCRGKALARSRQGLMVPASDVS